MRPSRSPAQAGRPDQRTLYSRPVTNAPPTRRSLPGWLVPVTALVIAAIVATLVLTLHSDRTPEEVANDTAHSFAAALNSHDVDTVQTLSCAGFSKQAKKLADTVHKAQAQASVQAMHVKTDTREQAVLQIRRDRSASAVALPAQVVLDVEQHSGLWLICGQS